MITERKFSIAYTSFWRSCTPTADNFIRHLNMGCSRYLPPHVAEARASSNGMVNEVAYRLAKRLSAAGDGCHYERAAVEAVWDEVVEWMGDFYIGAVRLPDKEFSDIKYVSKSILLFLNSNFIDVSFGPEFRGCGVISECAGDVLADDVLIEIKAGGRSFRVTDLRQLFVYFALAREDGDKRIRRLCLLNPRWGVFWIGTADEAAVACGAASAADLSEEIVRGASVLSTSN